MAGPAPSEVRTSDTFYLGFNAHWDETPFTLPPADYGTAWSRVIDTADPDADGDPVPAEGVVALAGRSIVLLRRLPG